MSKRIVIALGGNALGNTAAQQLDKLNVVTHELVASGRTWPP